LKIEVALLSRTRRRQALRQATLVEGENFACANYLFVSEFNQPSALLASVAFHGGSPDDPPELSISPFFRVLFPQRFSISPFS
jgi:hypothetical protein